MKKGKEKEVMAMVKSKGIGMAASMKGNETSAVVKRTGVGAVASKNIATMPVDCPKAVSAVDRCQVCKIQDISCYHDKVVCTSCHEAKRKREFLESEYFL